MNRLDSPPLPTQRPESRRALATTGHRALLIALCVLSVAGTSLATQTLVSLSGTVTGNDGNPVSGARVRLESGPSGSKETLTDSGGEFSIADLEPGSYRLRIEATGYKIHETTEAIAGEVSARIELRRLTLDTEITVTSSLPEFGSGFVLEIEDLESRSSDDLFDALRYESGLTSFRRGRINLDPYVRGLQETEVGMFVDGTRTFSAGPGRMDSELSHVSPHAVQNVQVVKGPYALAWGSGTMSAIQLETFRPSFSSGAFDLGGRVDLAYGDNADTVDGFASLWGAGDSVRFNLLANARSGSDYETGNGNIVPGNFESTDLRGSLDFATGQSGLLFLDGAYQEQNDIDYPGRLLDATFFKTNSASAKYTHTGSGSVSVLMAQIYVNNKDHLMNNDNKPTAQPMPGRIPPFGLEVHLPASSDTRGGRFSVDFAGDVWQTKAGVDYYRLEQSALRTISRRDTGMIMFEDIVWPDAVFDDAGIYGQVIYRGASFEIGGAVRFDAVDVAAGEVSDFFLKNTAGELDRSEDNVSAAVNAQFRLHSSWTMSAGLGRAVRTANALERYSDRFPSTKFQISAEIMGDPSIEPEESLEITVGSRHTADANLLVVVDLFYREIDNYIDIVADPSIPTRLPLSPRPVYRYITGTQADFLGGELRLEQRIGDHFQWRGSLDYVHAEDRLFDEPVIGIPPLQAQLGARVQSTTGRYWGDVNMTVADRQDRVAVSRFEQPTAGFTFFDLRGGVVLDNGLELRLAVENFTDKDYVHHLNSPDPFARVRIPEMGRNVRFGVGYAF